MKTLLITLLFCFPVTISIAQDGIIGTYIFSNYTPIEVPTEMASEESFFISNVRTVNFDNAGNTSINLFQRIYVNSIEASESLSQKEMYFSGEGKLIVFNARKINKDGSIFNLTKEHFTKTTSNKLSKYEDNSLDRVQLLVPDLQVGDVLDIAYTLEFDRYLLSDILYLEDDLPSLYSRISFRNNSLLELQLFPFNGMPEVKFENNDGIESTSFEKTNVPALRTDFFNTIPPTNAGFNYTLWYTGVDFNYAAIYDADIANYPRNFSPSANFRNALPISDSIKDLSKMQQVMAFMDYLEQNFRFQPYARSSNNALIRDRFKEEVVSPRLYSCYLMKFLNDFDIKYARTFSKPLYNGVFRNNLISLEQIDTRFLVVYDEDDNIHLIFPPTVYGSFYKIDECPFYLEGNNGIGLLGDNKNLETDFDISLPGSDASSNIRRSMIYATITDFDSITAKRFDKFEGQFSNLARRAFSKDWFEEWNVIVSDSAERTTDNIFPYAHSIQSDRVNLPLKFQQFSDSLVTFDLSTVLPQGIYEEDELNRTIDVYGVLPFAKTESVSMNLEMPTDIKIGEGMAPFKFENELGSIVCTARAIGTTKLKIQFKLTVKKRFVFKEDAEAYMNLLEEYHNLRSKKWIFTLVK